MMKYSKFEVIYHKYCPILYVLVLDIVHSKIKAEEILISTFRKIRQENINHEENPAYFTTLLRIIIKIGKGLYPENFTNGFRIKQFENTPQINEFLCNKGSWKDYCMTKGFNPQASLQMMMEEFSTLKGLVKVNRDITLTIPESVNF